MKSIKNLFIKDDDSEPEKTGENLGFPVSDSATISTSVSSTSGSAGGDNPYLNEIIEVYEKGLESINMPGYDFYDYYKAIRAAGAQNEAIYKMAFQMGKTMDANITPGKLVTDADYYISKLKEVHHSYSEKGIQMLNSMESELRTSKDNLNGEVSHIEADMVKMKQQISNMEKKLAETKEQLQKVDSRFKPQRDVIEKKLQANELAMELSIKKLNTVKDGITKFIK